MKKIGQICAVLADIVGSTAFIWLVILSCNSRSPIQDHMDMHSILVGFLGAVITLLVGWNIYSVIDYKEVKAKLERELNYAHNKMDYNHAITFSFLCQNCVASLSPVKKPISKFQMLTYGLSSLKILVNIPDTNKELASTTNTIIEGLYQTANIRLTDNERDDMLMLCGSIQNINRISRFEELVELIKKS